MEIVACRELKHTIVDMTCFSSHDKCVYAAR